MLVSTSGLNTEHDAKHVLSLAHMPAPTHGRAKAGTLSRQSPRIQKLLSGTEVRHRLGLAGELKISLSFYRHLRPRLPVRRCPAAWILPPRAPKPMHFLSPAAHSCMRVRAKQRVDGRRE